MLFNIVVDIIVILSEHAKPYVKLKEWFVTSSMGDYTPMI
jgi:hypothetical protein